MRLPPNSPDSILSLDDAEVFATLLIDDPGRALRLLAERPELVRVAQAIALGWIIAVVPDDSGACRKEAL